MSSTSAVEANIHAVSPELILATSTTLGAVGAAGAAGAAACVVSLWRFSDSAALPETRKPIIPHNNTHHRNRFMANSQCPASLIRRRKHLNSTLECSFTGFTGANANG